MANVIQGKKPPTKTEILANIAAATHLSKKQVAAVLEALMEEIRKSLGATGSGVFTLPGLLKIEKRHFAARPAQRGLPNPFKPGQTMDRPARPAYSRIKVRALKTLKDMVRDLEPAAPIPSKQPGLPLSQQPDAAHAPTAAIGQ